MITFEQMPADARVWIYQADRDLTDAEVADIQKKAAMFLMEWTSHGKLMLATVEVKYNRFVIQFDSSSDWARITGWTFLTACLWRTVTTIPG
jgi:hypothetical protein